jgi:site-specific DNA-methyltransferase (cytosine-N4-specific)
MTGRVAETLQRKWLSFEIDENYVKSSQLRFEKNAPLVVELPADLLPIDLENSLNKSQTIQLGLF